MEEFFNLYFGGQIFQFEGILIHWGENLCGKKSLIFIFGGNLNFGGPLIQFGQFCMWEI